MSEPQSINVSAMILCDGVAYDRETGKTTIVGCSSGFRMNELPEMLPPFAVYILFSEVTRKVRLDVRIVSSDDDVIFELPPAMVEPGDPLESVEYDARFADVNVDRPGDYFVRLLADGLYIIEIRFGVWLNDKEL